MAAYSRSDRVLGNIHRTKYLTSFVNYVQDAFNDPPGLMFRYTCEDVTPIDGVHSQDGVTIYRPESYEPYVTCIFDDETDNLTYAYDYCCGCADFHRSHSARKKANRRNDRCTG